jgi:hypothetical protein
MQGGISTERLRANGGAAKSRRIGARETIDEVVWTPKDGMTLEGWTAAGRRLGLIGKGMQWWLGDWIRFGNARWGERYREAARITGYEVGTLRNMAWVSGQFDPSLRRSELSWSHYPLLVKLPPDRRLEWIERAVEDRLSVEDLRIELRRVNPDQGETGPPRETVGDRAEPEANEFRCPHCGKSIAHEDSSLRSDKQELT